MEQLEGRQPVREALRAGRRIARVMVAEGAQTRGTLAEIVELAERAGARVERWPRAELDRIATTRSHQGVIAEAEPARARSWREGVEAARADGRVPLVLALDGIEDPQNMGALLRSAEAFGADAVIVPKRRSSAIGAAVAKASAGAVEHLIVDRVPNLERALASCREEGLWIVATAADAEITVDRCDLLGEPVVIVVGSEGEGVSALVRRRADQGVRIPLAGRVASLNASVAGAILLWEAARRRVPRN